MSLRLWTAILAALQILTAGTALADLIGVRWAAVAVLVIGAAQAGTAVYMRGTAPAGQVRLGSGRPPV